MEGLGEREHGSEENWEAKRERELGVEREMGFSPSSYLRFLFSPSPASVHKQPPSPLSSNTSTSSLFSRPLLYAHQRRIKYSAVKSAVTTSSLPAQKYG